MHDIEWLQEWFQAQCDGDWEHGNSIKINTLDNPGWMIRVNLVGTALENRAFAEVDERFRSEHDWITCRLRDGEFQGFGGPQNLTEILTIFRTWATS